MSWFKRKQYYRRETDGYTQAEREIVELLKETIFYLKIYLEEGKK